MNSRPCKIAVVIDADLPNKEQYVAAIRPFCSYSVIRIAYKPDQALSEADLAIMTDRDLLYFIYDASPDKKDSRVKIPSLLAQIQDAKAKASESKLKCILAGAATAPSVEAVSIVQRGAKIAKNCDFMPFPLVLCTSDQNGMNKFREAVARQAQLAVTPDDHFGKVVAAVPNSSSPAEEMSIPASPPVDINADVASSIPQSPLQQPALSSLVNGASLDASMQQGISELNQSIKLAEQKLELQRLELENLKKLRDQAGQVAKMFPEREKKPGEWLVILKQLNETAAKIMDGRKDLVKIVGGAIGVVIGVALLAAAIPLYLFVPPLAVAATTVALNIITASVALSAGLGLTALGAYSIYRGREQGVTQQSKRYVELAERKPLTMSASAS